MTADDPRPAGEADARVTDNRQRAAAMLRSRAYFIGGEHVLTAALDEAEARGRAEVAGKVAALAAVFVDSGGELAALARRFRALIAEEPA